MTELQELKNKVVAKESYIKYQERRISVLEKILSRFRWTVCYRKLNSCDTDDTTVFAGNEIDARDEFMKAMPGHTILGIYPPSTEA